MVVALSLTTTTQAALSVSNGDFESNPSQSTDVNGWFDTISASPANWWEATWAGPNNSPNGGSVLGLSYMNSTLNWAYQSIGINDTAVTNLSIQYDVGSFTDAGGARDIGLTFSVYESDGSFVGADDSDIDGAAGATLIDSITVYSGALSAGQMISNQSVMLDLSSAGTNSELFLRIQNEVGSTGEPWGAVDNLSFNTGTNTSPPVTTNTTPFTNVLVEAESFGLDRVRLLDSRFKDMQELHRTGYLAWVDPDRLLSPFRYNAGLSTLGASDLGGWENSTNGFTRGHMAGHYLSAASKMYASTGDTNYLPKVQYLVAELKKCQDALRVSEESSGRPYGYLSAFPSSWFDGLETNPHGWNNVPFYTIHKIIAGLIDAYKYCGNDQALDSAIDMSDYHSWRVSRLTDSQIEEMFRTDNGNSEEWGGMNESLTELYLLSNARGDTNATRHLDFAKVFDRDWFINPLESNTDQLNGLHANTHVPQVVGFAHLASVLSTNDTERARLYTAAGNFWNMVVSDHSFVLGGNSYAEHFSTPGKETGTGGSALSWNTAETCNTYNMLKLTGELMQHNPSAAYADYYERALYNHILASISPETGMATYFVSMEPGHFKTYGLPEGSCWCCTGSGLENPAQYGQYIYQHRDDTLWVNLFIPSTLDWSEQGIQLQMDTSFPNSDQIQLSLGCASPVHASIRLRIPDWIASSATVQVNGAVQSVAASAGSYTELDRTWNDGDIITLTLPMNLRLDRSMDDATQISMFYGPVLLAGDLGTNNLPGNFQETKDQWDFENVSDVAAPSLMASDAENLSSWVHSTSTSLVFTVDTALAGAASRGTVLLKPFYDTHHTRYTVYWNLIAPAAFSSWNGGVSRAWSESGNWDAVPSTDYGLRFAASAGGTLQNDYASGTAFNGLDFPAGGGAYTLNGNAVDLFGDIVNDSSQTQAINLPLALQDGLSWYFDANGADIELGGTLSGSGVIVKHGANTLSVLSNAAFNGSIHVAEGNLQVGNGGASGSIGSVPVTLATNTTLVLDRSDTVDFESAVAGDGVFRKRGGGPMNLLSSMDAKRLVVEGGSVQIASAPKQILAHRWSFNNSLADSVGGVSAQQIDVGANNTTLTANYIELAGGIKSSSDYVQLGSGLLPKDGTPVTIELWATQTAVQQWSRIFDVGSSTADNLFMSWDRGGNISQDRVEWKDASAATADDTCAPYSLGTEYHIVMVIEPGAGAGGTTRVTWYAAPSATASLGAAKDSFETANTLADLNDVNFWLGRSEYNDSTASARYNEVRLWGYALGSSTLEQLHDLGPDDLGGLDSITLTGSLSSNTELDVRAGASFDLSGTSLQISSLSGSSNAVLNLGSGGSLVIGSGGDPAAVFGGTVGGSGSVEVDGTLRLVGDASLPAGIALVNNGLLDIMTWSGTLPVGFVNNGTIIDRSMVQCGMNMATFTNVVLQAPGYEGHNYQFQTTTNLGGAWSNLGPSQAGSGVDITHEVPLDSDTTFFRLQVQP